MFEIVQTADGSHSVYSTHIKEQYHSSHGAIQESMHVFIHAGLHTKLNQQKDIHILEIGFGTGLNALLTLLESSTHNCEIFYTSFEKFPIPVAVYQQLNYGTLIQDLNAENIYPLIYSSPWNIEHRIDSHFILKKMKLDFHEIDFKNEFDIIYFDAFSPTSQPELWTAGIFQLMYDSLKPNGILVSYCAKGIVKRTLKSVGFKVEALAGPKGKREMVRAIKI